MRAAEDEAAAEECSPGRPHAQRARARTLDAAATFRAAAAAAAAHADDCAMPAMMRTSHGSVSSTSSSDEDGHPPVRNSALAELDDSRFSIEVDGDGRASGSVASIQSIALKSGQIWECRKKLFLVVDDSSETVRAPSQHSVSQHLLELLWLRRREQ